MIRKKPYFGYKEYLMYRPVISSEYTASRKRIYIDTGYSTLLSNYLTLWREDIKNSRNPVIRYNAYMAIVRAKQYPDMIDMLTAIYQCTQITTKQILQQLLDGIDEAEIVLEYNKVIERNKSITSEKIKKTYERKRAAKLSLTA